MKRKKGGTTSKISFYEELAPDLKTLLGIYKKSAKGRAYVLESLDKAVAQFEDSRELKQFFIDIKRAFQNSEVKTI